MPKKNIWDEYIDPIIKKWFLSPFSNLVTKTFLFVGAGLVATPLLGHLIIKVILSKYFDINIPIDVPDIPAYIAGVILMVSGSAYHLIHTHLVNIGNQYKIVEMKEKMEKEMPHDQGIIEGILQKLPYENTRFWIERAPIAGIRRDFARGLEECEKYITPPFNLYNQAADYKKRTLIAKIIAFNKAAYTSGYLGAQEDTTGEMYLPPYHWKGHGGKSEERYYKLQDNLSDAGQDLLKEYDEFITLIKSEGFVIGKI
ncbi:hypothetical protein [Marinomonas sp. BSi20584]|uniref:hypothetical protein n=1 Tax=Marinomonas sp. BSi20584 TaxID=1594462 RepID=UPI000C1EC0F9|nr:hypothetical protein [Marinomonas sp. BSi20584]